MKLHVHAIRAFIVASVALFTAAPVGALPIGSNVGLELVVEVDSVVVGTAIGGADASTNTPLVIDVLGGETIDVTLQMDPGVVVRGYDTTVDVNATDLSFVSGTELTGLAFDPAADPNSTLTDGTPGTGPANGAFCALEVGCPDPTNPLYTLRFTVVPGFANDGVRDLTITTTGFTFVNFDTLNGAADTVSLTLNFVPEPATGTLLLLGIAGLAGARRSRR